jgi:photosystem II stability/assembly factor-like uncharacterized protein
MKQFMILIIIIIFPLTSAMAQYASIWDHFPEEVRKTNAFNRFKWQYQQIAFPYDTIPMYKYSTELKNEINKINSHLRKSNSEVEWIPIGPTGIENPSWLSPHWGVSSGRVRAIAVNPIYPSILYIGAASGGIWKTTNGGDTWEDIGNSVTKILTFGSIAIDSNNPDIIYAGTGEIHALSWTRHYGKGLYKSTDAGISWFEPTDTFGTITFFGDLVVSPYNSNIVYAALGSGYLFINPNQQNEGIWKSTDGGSHWIRTLNVQDAYDIVVHPTDPNIVYAATGGKFTTSGFYKSSTAGETWQHIINTGLQSPTTINRMQIDIAKSSPNILYAVIYDGLDNTPKAYKSIDSGNVWFPISAGTQLGGNYGSGWVDQGGYDLCIAVDPTNPNHVFIGNVEIHETTNGADFFVKRISGGNNAWKSVVHVDYHRLVYAPSDPNIFFIGCDGGIYKSPDNGATFTNLNNGISTIQFYNIASHPANEYIMIGGAQDNWTSITFDLTSMNPWVAVTGGDGTNCFFNYDCPDSIVYASYQFGNLKKSTDGGNSFFSIGNMGGWFTTPFFMHPTNPETLYSANNRIWRSTNGGDSWSVISDPPIVVQNLVVTMAQSKANSDNLILAGGGSFSFPNNPEVKISTDGGIVWSNDLSPNIPGEPRWITKVVTHPSESNTMYIVRSGLSENNKIYRTTDLGNTWTNISGDLPNLPCWDLFVDPHNINPNNTNHLYAGMDVGVYRSTNAGNSWEYVSANIPLMPVFDFDYVEYGTNAKLRVGTYGRSAYETEWSIPLYPSAPILIAPSDSVYATEFEFIWTSSYPGIDRYWFEIDSTEQFSTSFIDSTIIDTSYLYSSLQDKKEYWWRVKAANSFGWGDFSEVGTFVVNITNVDEGNQLPIEFSLEQNYPNPFNPVTTIKYSIPKETNVSLLVFNALGKEVANLVNETQQSGNYVVKFNATTLPSGVYYYQIKAGELVQAKKMMVLK